MQMNKCQGCVWGTQLSRKKLYCFFPECVKEKSRIKMLTKDLDGPEIPWADSGESLAT